MTPPEYKVLENRIRRQAKRHLLELHRTRRRDPMAWDFGLYTLTDSDGNTVATSTLAAIHAYLTTPR